MTFVVPVGLVAAAADSFRAAIARDLRTDVSHKERLILIALRLEPSGLSIAELGRALGHPGRCQVGAQLKRLAWKGHIERATRRRRDAKGRSRPHIVYRLVR